MTTSKSIQITNPRQFSKLVELLEENPELAKSYHTGIHKININGEWDKIARKLNALGPPFREGPKWMKVWADYKFKLKKKLTHNKSKCRSTGGGSNKQFILTATEEAAVSLLQLNSIINPEGQVFGIQQNSPKEMEHITEDADMTENEENVPPSTPLISRKSTTKKVAEKNDLIEEQLKVQTNLYNEVKEALKQIERYSRKEHKINEEKLKLYKSEVKRKEEKFKLYKSDLKRKEEKFNLYKNELKKKDAYRKHLVKLREEEINIETRRIELEEWRHGFKK